jgi:hypothetical protein
MQAVSGQETKLAATERAEVAQSADSGVKLDFRVEAALDIVAGIFHRIEFSKKNHVSTDRTA